MELKYSDPLTVKIFDSVVEEVGHENPINYTGPKERKGWKHNGHNLAKTTQKEGTEIREIVKIFFFSWNSQISK